MAKLKVENQRRQKVLTAYRMELLSLFFFLAVVDIHLKMSVRMAYTRTLVVLCNIREVASLSHSVPR